MDRTVSVAGYCLFAVTAGACAVTMALRPPEQELLKTVSTTQGTAYLDCAVVQRNQGSEPDLVAPCSMLA